MASIRKLPAGEQSYDPATYVGTTGTIFYNEDTGEFRRSDGVTPGGFPIPITLATNSVAGSVKPSDSFNLNPADGTLSLLIATEDRIGGVRLGPGVTTNEQGQIIIDSEGLDFSFGDFAAVTETYPEGHPKEGEQYAILQTINDDEDAVIASNGLGSVKVVGNFQIYSPDGTVNGALIVPPIFTVGNDGQVKILVPNTDTNEGAVEIIGSSVGESISPGQPGSMLHITGQPGEQARVYIDGNGEYASIIGRRWNGTITGGRTQVLANEDILRINATAQTNTQMPGIAAAQMRFVATENHTDAAQGSKIEFIVTRNGTTAASRETGLIIDNNGIEIPGPNSGVIFYGDTSGTIALRPTAIAGTNTITLPAATGTAIVSTAGANIVTGVLAGTINIDPTSVAGSSSSTQTFTLTGLTTNHKLVITSGTAFTEGVIITAAWASALNTISIAFRNTTNQPIDPGDKTIQYFAWV